MGKEQQAFHDSGLNISRFVIPAEAGIQHEETPRAADKTMMVFRLRGGCLIHWIPASAGMTG
jgi:hypothetical protein